MSGGGGGRSLRWLHKDTTNIFVERWVLSEYKNCESFPYSKTDT